MLYETFSGRPSRYWRAISRENMPPFFNYLSWNDERLIVLMLFLLQINKTKKCLCYIADKQNCLMKSWLQNDTLIKAENYKYTDSLELN